MSDIIFEHSDAPEPVDLDGVIFDPVPLKTWPETEYYLHRFENDSVKGSMSPIGNDFNIPFPSVKINNSLFYRINGKWWSLSHVGSDDSGIFAAFYKTKGNMEDYSQGS